MGRISAALLFLACAIVSASVRAQTAVAPYWDRVTFTSPTTGTGALAVGVAYPGPYQTPYQAGMVDGQTARYVIVDGSDWEIGIGTYYATGPTFARTTVQGGTGGTSPIDLDGRETVYFSATAQDFDAYAAVANGGVRTARITLTSAQLLAMHDTPVQLLPAPGANSMYLVVASSYRLNYGTIAYVESDPIFLFYENGSGERAGDGDGEVLANTIGSVVSSLNTQNVAKPVTGVFDQPLVVTSAADPTTGDGTLEVVVQYATVSF